MAGGFYLGSYELAAVAVPGVLAFSLYHFVRSRNAYAHLPLPPGPKASWLGQVSLPQKYQWKTYAEWKKIYGMFLQLNSRNCASHFLIRRPHLYLRFRQSHPNS